MTPTIYLADKEIAYCEILKRRGQGFKYYIKHLLYKHKNRSEPDDVNEIYQRMCANTWARVCSENFEFSPENIERTFIGAITYLSKSQLWKAGVSFDCFTELDTDDGLLFSDTLSFDVNDENATDFYLKYNFLQSALKELSIVEQSFITSYLNNDCSLVKTMYELGAKQWVSSTQMNLILAKIKGKINDPILLEMIQNSKTVKRSDGTFFNPGLSDIRYDIALETGLDIISRDVRKSTAKNYRACYLTFVRSVEDLFTDTRYSLKDFKISCFHEIFKDLTSRISQARYLSLCHCLRHICNQLVDRGYIDENLFWIAYKEYHNIKTKDREKTDEKVHLIREWAIQGLGKDEIYSNARRTWPHIQPHVISYGIRLAMAEGKAKKDLRSLVDIREERINIIVGWLKNPDFKVSQNDLSRFTADYFKTTMCTALKYVKPARERMGIDDITQKAIEEKRIKIIIDMAGDFSILFSDLTNLVSLEFGFSVISARVWISKAEKAAGKKCRRLSDVVKELKESQPVKNIKDYEKIQAERIEFITSTYPDLKISYTELLKVVSEKFDITPTTARKIILSVEEIKEKQFDRNVVMRVDKSERITMVCQMIKEGSKKMGEIRKEIMNTMNVGGTIADRCIKAAKKKLAVA